MLFMSIRGVVIASDGAGAGAIDRLVAGLTAARGDVVVGTIGSGGGSAAAFRLQPEQIGVEPSDPRLLAMAAAAAGCHLRELVVIAAAGSRLTGAAERTGTRLIPFDHGDAPPSAPELIAAIGRLADAEAVAARSVGRGPHPQPWPDDPNLDPLLLAEGDRRNVVDRYRYWTEDAIVADLDRRRLPVHVAVENWNHDLNIGTVVRNANAYNVAGVHVVGKRRWNRRGAMATDRYLTVHHHATIDAFAAWAEEHGLPIVGIDNLPGSVAIETAVLPSRCVLVFGQEGPGLSDAVVAACTTVCAITQHGSTRSFNAGVASGIALYAWASTNAPAEAAAWPHGGLVP